MFDYQGAIEIFSLLPMKRDHDSTYLYGMATMFLSIGFLEGMPMDIHFVSPSPCLGLDRKVALESPFLSVNLFRRLVNLPFGFVLHFAMRNDPFMDDLPSGNQT